MGGRASKETDPGAIFRQEQIKHIKKELASTNEVYFENLVFEGGGSRCIAYYGALKTLEDAGALVHTRRYGGTSTGAFWAMFLSVAMSPTSIALKIPDAASIYDSRLGVLNMVRIFGWHALNKTEKVLLKVIGEQTGKADITFKEVYERYGRELCIVATNLTTSRLEYFHPKTTPDLSIVEAAIMAATPPALAKPRYLLRGTKKHYFVDGGVLCNFPIHSFDGWYLSMKKDDSFLSRLGLGAAEPPFKGYNPKTLGFLLVTPGEGEFGEQEFLRRLDYETVQRPNTKLVKFKGSASEDKWQRVISRDRTLLLGESLLRALRESTNHEGQITLQEFQAALRNVGGSDQDLQRLFGYNSGELTQIFEELDRSKGGKTTLEEVLERVQQQGGSLHQPAGGSTSTMDLYNVSDFFKAVMSAIKVNSKQVYMKDIDIHRSVGINTDYVGAMDHVQSKDKQFLLLQGEIACIAFLWEYIRKYIEDEPSPQVPRASVPRLSTPPAAEMRNHTVPAGLYPTLPPSYESATRPDIQPSVTPPLSEHVSGTGLYPDLVSALQPVTEISSEDTQSSIPAEKLGVPPVSTPAHDIRYGQRLTGDLHATPNYFTPVVALPQDVTSQPFPFERLSLTSQMGTPGTTHNSVGNGQIWIDPHTLSTVPLPTSQGQPQGQQVNAQPHQHQAHRRQHKGHRRQHQGHRRQDQEQNRQHQEQGQGHHRKHQRRHVPHPNTRHENNGQQPGQDYSHSPSNMSSVLVSSGSREDGQLPGDHHVRSGYPSSPPLRQAEQWSGPYAIVLTVGRPGTAPPVVTAPHQNVPHPVHQPEVWPNASVVNRSPQFPQREATVQGQEATLIASSLWNQPGYVNQPPQAAYGVYPHLQMGSPVHQVHVGLAEVARQQHY